MASQPFLTTKEKALVYDIKVEDMHRLKPLTTIQEVRDMIYRAKKLEQAHDYSPTVGSYGTKETDFGGRRRGISGDFERIITLHFSLKINDIQRRILVIAHDREIGGWGSYTPVYQNEKK